MDRSKVAPAAGNLTLGLVLLVVAGVLANVYSQLQITSALTPYGGEPVGTWLLAVAGVGGLVGLVVMVMGVYQLATNIDYLADRAVEAHDREVRESAASAVVRHEQAKAERAAARPTPDR
ncbi:hypothetical protein [Actinotalea sp. JY-7876]|uniref:hypothetical protein n=1 Tax=Actinotalea sp. JY-7876 TaxID=2758442 RepID=UPI0015F5EA95|nr:hypothetical protein [Actinotalea sp. JY-7876]